MQNQLPGTSRFLFTEVFPCMYKRINQACGLNCQKRGRSELQRKPRTNIQTDPTQPSLRITGPSPGSNLPALAALTARHPPPPPGHPPVTPSPRRTTFLPDGGTGTTPAATGPARRQAGGLPGAAGRMPGAGLSRRGTSSARRSRQHRRGPGRSRGGTAAAPLNAGRARGGMLKFPSFFSVSFFF